MPPNTARLAANQTEQRGRAMLTQAFGPVVQAALDDPAITEIILNPDGRLWTEVQGQPMRCTPHRMSGHDAERLICLLATHVGMEAGRDQPIVSAELPGSGARFEGLLPPVVTAPCFLMRKAARQIFRLDDYIRAQVMTVFQAELLKAAVELKRNILVVGGTATGKTTLANALLAELARSHDRLVILEDTRELQLASKNIVQLKSSDAADLRTLVRSTLRLRPDRIIIGEVRGAEALDLLKAWNTGHSGGIATIHANGARASLVRLEQLCLEAVTTPPRALIAEAVQIVVVISGRGHERRITEIMQVEGLDAQGDYRLKNLVPLVAVPQVAVAASDSPDVGDATASSGSTTRVTVAAPSTPSPFTPKGDHHA